MFWAFFAQFIARPSPSGSPWVGLTALGQPYGKVTRGHGDMGARAHTLLLILLAAALVGLTALGQPHDKVTCGHGDTWARAHPLPLILLAALRRPIPSSLLLHLPSFNSRPCPSRPLCVRAHLCTFAQELRSALHLCTICRLPLSPCPRAPSRRRDFAAATPHAK